MYRSPFLVDFKAILLTKGIYRNDSVREPNLYYTDYEQPSTINHPYQFLDSYIKKWIT